MFRRSLFLFVVVTFAPCAIAAPAVTSGAGLAAATARVAFDALVQRDGPPGARGSTFARFETRFQLVWVFGALLAIIPWDRFLGFAIMAGAAAATIAMYMKGEPALERLSDLWNNATGGLTNRFRRAIARRAPDPLGDPFSDT